MGIGTGTDREGGILVRMFASGVMDVAMRDDCMDGVGFGFGGVWLWACFGYTPAYTMALFLALASASLAAR